MIGPVERAVRGTVSSGDVLTTPSRSAPFTVSVLDADGVVLLLGESEAQTRFSWQALEGVRDLLAHGNWMPIGSSYSTEATPNTLDAYLKQYVNRATAGWVVALLEAADVVVIDRTRPAQVRLRSGATS